MEGRAWSDLTAEVWCSRSCSLSASTFRITGWRDGGGWVGGGGRAFDRPRQKMDQMWGTENATKKGEGDAAHWTACIRRSIPWELRKMNVKMIWHILGVDLYLKKIYIKYIDFGK